MTARTLARLGSATLTAIVATLAVTAAAFGAAPSTGPGTGGDPRSSGEGPGLVGDPLFAIGAVLAIGIVTVGLTVAYVRLTNPRSPER